MKKIFYLILTVVFASCATIKLPTEKTVFQVDQIIISKDNKSAYYLLHPVNEDDLNCSDFWVCDSVGAYQKNEKISFFKTK